MLGVTALVTRRLGAVAIVVIAFVLMSTSLALAHRTRQYGEMVDYSLVFPVDGQVSVRDTFYAARSNGDHHAQDLMAPKMTPIVAAASGTVRYVNWSNNSDDLNPERCCTIAIRHDDGWESWYIHLNNDTPGTDDGAAWGIADGIVPGVHVEAGQHIGWVGDSGNAENTGSHLHFELFDPAGVVVNSYNALLAVCGSRCTQTGSASTSQTSTSPTSTSQTSTAIAGPNDTLIYGSRGSVVSDLQSTLKSLGFNPGPVDGIFGGLTLTAVEAFQLARGLTVDGKVGPATKGALASSPAASVSATSDPGSVVAYGINGSNVVDLQTMLARLGHNPGPIDGAFGPLTLGAVRTFQTSVGLSGTGTVDQATWDTLVSAAGSGSDAPTIVVAYGARGSQVFDLQTRLDALGHGPGPIDGIFGPKTRGAVTAFQGVADLTANGIVDQATWDALVAAGG
ncbi:MAG: peptidoglycan-binding protein [Acidimicrobiia bacterium]